MVTVISWIRRRHRAVEFKKFRVKIGKRVPEDLADVHVICDNYTTYKHPEIPIWMGKHPQFHGHFTPMYSLWINQAKLLFAKLTRELL